MTTAKASQKHEAGPFRGVGHHFIVETNVAAVAAHLRRVYAELSVPEAAGASPYRLEELRTGGAPRYRAQWGPDLIVESADPAHALAMLLWDVNRRTVEVSTDVVLLHAAGAVRDGRAVVLPAPMESGKTTLVAGLIREGFRYLSDELIALDVAKADIRGYPKALSLDEGSWDVLPELRPVLDAELVPWMWDQWQVPPASIRADASVASALPRFVVFPRYEAGGTTALTPMHRADALVELAACTFGFNDDPQAKLPVLGRLARASRCYRLQMSCLADACGVIDALFHEEE